MNFALIENGIVTNVIVADSLESASLLGFAVESTKENYAAIGWNYDSETGKFNNSFIVTEETVD